MKDKPILFSGPMVSKILIGQKTQTRRVIKGPGEIPGVGIIKSGDDEEWPVLSSPYHLGMILWVRETWNLVDRGKILYRADYDMPGMRWKPSIFMPREACRIRLEVVAVRAEELQDISEEDARAEGVKSVASYSELWDELNFDRGYGWRKNPFVWVVEFRRKI
jgi:hypothetical protein